MRGGEVSVLPLVASDAVVGAQTGLGLGAELADELVLLVEDGDAAREFAALTDAIEALL